MPANRIWVHWFVTQLWGSIAGRVLKFRGAYSWAGGLERVNFEASDDGLGAGRRKRTRYGSLIIPKGLTVGWDVIRREIERRIKSGESLDLIRAF